jgi:hypothetical protein
MRNGTVPETEGGPTQLDRIEEKLGKIEAQLGALLQILGRIRSISPVVSASGAPIVRR